MWLKSTNDHMNIESVAVCVIWLQKIMFWPHPFQKTEAKGLLESSIIDVTKG